jgi:carbon storage regulator
MLVLTRKVGEKVFIMDCIVVTILEVSKNRVRMGVEAPLHIGIEREEIRQFREQTEEEKRS